MRSILILSFVAAATTLSVPEPIRLPEPAKPQTVGDQYNIISFMPLIVPDEVAEAFRRDLEINPPINEQSLPSPVDAVRVVEIPEIEATAEHVLPVNFVDAPLEEVTDFEEEIAPSPVKVIDAPLNEDVAAMYVAPLEEELDPVPVKFIDALIDEVAAAKEDIAPSPVKFVDSPLSEDVAAMDNEEVLDLFQVKFVDAPEEVEAAKEEIEPRPVNFVDAPTEEILDAVRVVNFDQIAPSSDEVVPVKFVDAPLEEDSDVTAKMVPSPVKIVDAANERPFKFYDPLLR